MNQTVLDQLTTAVTQHFADQPLEPFDASMVEVIVMPARHDVAPAGNPPMPIRGDIAFDDLALATWEDAEWR